MHWSLALHGLVQRSQIQVVEDTVWEYVPKRQVCSSRRFLSGSLWVASACLQNTAAPIITMLFVGGMKWQEDWLCERSRHLEAEAEVPYGKWVSVGKVVFSFMSSC